MCSDKDAQDRVSELDEFLSGFDGVKITGADGIKLFELLNHIVVDENSEGNPSEFTELTKNYESADFIALLAYLYESLGSMTTTASYINRVLQGTSSALCDLNAQNPDAAITVSTTSLKTKETILVSEIVPEMDEIIVAIANSCGLANKTLVFGKKETFDTPDK